MRGPIAHVLQTELDRGIAEGVFPSGAAAVAAGDGPLVVHETHPGAIYDIASLTKLFTALLAHRLRLQELLDLERPLAVLWPELAGRPVGLETTRGLLAHRSGLPAWLPLYTDHRGAAIVTAAAAAPTDSPRPLYSDLGYILLGALCERRAGATLPELLAREVTVPLGLPSVRFGPIEPSLTLPTGTCPGRDGTIRGEVNDENAAALGGVAGHAGLFAHVSDVCALGRSMLACLESDTGLLPPALAREAVTPEEPGTHALGFDTTKPSGSSAGSRMGSRTFGHLGFTGCSLWIDPDVRLVVALLTNRVHPTRENVAIRAFRPAFHDAVYAAATSRG